MHTCWERYIVKHVSHFGDSKSILIENRKTMSDTALQFTDEDVSGNFIDKVLPISLKV